jgi:hypothetical protein
MKIELINQKKQRPPLWSSGQSSWLQIQRSRVRFPALPDFLRSSKSGTGSTRPCDCNCNCKWGAISRKWRLRSKKNEINVRGDLLLWPHDTLYRLKLALTSPTNGSHAVDIVRLRAKTTELKKQKTKRYKENPWILPSYYIDFYSTKSISILLLLFNIVYLRDY